MIKILNFLPYLSKLKSNLKKKFESYSDQNGIVTFGLSTNEDTMGEQGVVQWPTFTAYQNGNKVEELLNDDLEILDAYINKYRNKSITNDVAGGCNVS